MKMNLTARNMVITPAITERIEKKIVVTKQDVSGSQIHLQV